jgi:hypothetical protein
MKLIYSIILIGLFVHTGYAQKTDKITFDGVVDSEEWSESQRFEIAFEFNPGDNVPSPYRTEAYVTYDEEYLLVGFVASADMKNLRSSIRNRDEAWVDDFVFFGVDTYSDGRYMINFGSNPEGSQLDMKINSNGNDDESYDVNYFTKTSKHSDAYHIEMMIPFNVLQFEAKSVMDWKVVFYRSTYSGDNRSQNLNFPIDRENPCLICQTPASIRIENIEKKNRTTLLPNIFAGTEGLRNEDRLEYGELRTNFGLSGLFDINNTTSLEFAINPDFSQVEADVTQIAINNTFAIQYPERRPYFNEGNDLIQSNLETVYTRSINKPLVSTKLINQGKRQRYYWLTALDENSPYLVAGENESYFGQGGSSFANIFRYQRNFQGGSNLGFLTTNRFYKGGGEGNTFSVDGLFRIRKSYTLGFELNGTSILEPNADWIESDDVIDGKTVRLDGEHNTGNSVLLFMGRSSKNWNTDLFYTQASPWYATPLGFATQNNTKTFNVRQGYQHFFDEESSINSLNANVVFRTTQNFYGVNKQSFLRGQIYMALDKNIAFELSHRESFNEEFYGFVAKDLSESSLFLSYNPNEKINLEVFTSAGDAIYRDRENPEVGKSLFIGSFNNFQLSPKLRVSPSIRYSKLSKVDRDELFYEGYIFRGNMNFQFNRDISLRVITEKNDFGKTWFLQTLLQYNPNPFTIFYIGGSTGYSLVDNLNNSYQTDSNQLYLKFQYMFDL